MSGQARTAMPRPSTLTPLGDAKAWLKEHLDEGVSCPCCSQLAKIYKRKIHAGMARGLIAAYRNGGGNRFVHAPSLVPDYQNTDFARLVLWALVEEEPSKREDGGRPGWYRLTARGIAWVRDAEPLHKYVLTFNNSVFRREGPMVTIRDALGSKFNYEELMAG